jgi:hypothetical protein
MWRREPRVSITIIRESKRVVFEPAKHELC